MKCDCAADRSFNSDARHLAMNSPGVIAAGTGRYALATPTCTRPRVNHFHARFGEVTHVPRRHGHAPRARDGRDLAVRLRDRMSGSAAGGGNFGVGTRRTAVERKNPPGEQTPVRSAASARPRRRAPAGRMATPVRTSASVTAVTNSSRGGSLSIQTRTSALGVTRISSDTTFVSTTTMAVSVEARRLTHRAARRQLQLDSAEGFEQLVNRRPQTLLRLSGTPSRPTASRRITRTSSSIERSLPAAH